MMGARKSNITLFAIITLLLLLLRGDIGDGSQENQLRSRGKSQVEAHGKGSMGLAAAATGKGMNTVLEGLRRSCSDLAGEINWYKKMGKSMGRK